MQFSSLIKGRTTRPLKPALRCLHVALEELSHVSGVISAWAWKLQVHLKQSSMLSLKEGGECVIRKHDGLMSGDFAVCCRVWCDKKNTIFWMRSRNIMHCLQRQNWCLKPQTWSFYNPDQEYYNSVVRRNVKFKQKRTTNVFSFPFSFNRGSFYYQVIFNQRVLYFP